MVWIIGRSRRCIPLAKTLISKTNPPPSFRHLLLPSNSLSTSSTKPLNIDIKKKSSPFESNLVRMLTDEIDFESDYSPPHQPDKKFNAFMVEDRPGEQFVTLLGRSTLDENIKIEATMFDGYATVSPNLRGENAEPNPQLHISLLIDISKSEGSNMLEFVCSALPERLEIQKVYAIGPDGTLSRPYMGPDFRGLDRRLQNALYEFLNARGVNNELSIFLHRYVWNKDKLEHLQRLKLLKSYIER
uniref:uncharacterized protein At2g39795, mitochondrial-like n=1 Tax=Erigeron canadensis TaxID=72917 RepID=UPI001CB97185|nr:uncharacterized protein At2g39795, mitochondrial-like [Erigeron canadensis]XP_043606863.1 uncharacterized protein At2g39795, mitochondrial-like [Erigeron canadensis]